MKTGLKYRSLHQSSWPKPKRNSYRPKRKEPTMSEIAIGLQRLVASAEAAGLRVTRATVEVVE